ncbi:hypothetical protein F4808DRAFT_455860 [Astrocystis sublimbata]|nr:hypothetical protein F4808DRAFT_455860 [Astrocystis sublimbata]
MKSAAVLTTLIAGAYAVAPQRDSPDHSFDLIEYPATDGDADKAAVKYCVMENDIGHAPIGWRFRIDSGTYTGKGSLKIGAKIESLNSTMSLAAIYPMNKKDPQDSWNWAVNRSFMAELDVTGNAISNGDLAQDFKVTVLNEPDHWSWCFTSSVAYPDIQFSHQTNLFLGAAEEDTDAQGYIDSHLQLKLNLEWEKCDASGEPWTNWGRHQELPGHQNPHHK